MDLEEQFYGLADADHQFVERCRLRVATAQGGDGGHMGPVGIPFVITLNAGAIIPSDPILVETAAEAVRRTPR